jgi:hypothetical protein
MIIEQGTGLVQLKNPQWLNLPLASGQMERFSLKPSKYSMRSVFLIVGGL